MGHRRFIDHRSSGVFQDCATARVTLRVFRKLIHNVLVPACINIMSCRTILFVLLDSHNSEYVQAV